MFAAFGCENAGGDDMAMALILAAVAAFCWALFLYPHVIYPFALRMLDRDPVKKRPVDLPVSLLFCAYNEISSLPSKIDNLRALKKASPDLQILAYDDGSDDGSHDLLKSVPELLTVVRGSGRSGKAAGMKLLAARATGEVLLFTDANVLLACDVIQRLLPYYGDPNVGGVCGTLIYSSDPASVTAAVGASYWNLDERIRALESETGNVMGADGSIFSIRRSLYPAFPDTVLDDLTVSMNVIFAGRRLIKAPDVIACENSVSVRTEELRRKVRIGARAYHTHAYLRPQLRAMSAQDRFKYASHKLIRWFGGLFLAGGTVFGLAAVTVLSPLAGAVLAILTGGVLAWSTRLRSGAFARVLEMILATLATFAGVVQGMCGRTRVTWTPAASR